MNEILFFSHLLIISITTVIMLRFGHEALCAFLCVQAILANLFVLKQITLFGLSATASDIYIVGSVFSLNLVQEFFGKAEAKRTIWISFSMLIFYTVVSQFQIWYQASQADFTAEHYGALLGYMPRLTIASLVVYLVVQHFDTFFYGTLKKLFHGKHLLARNIMSITISQLLDTVLFSFIGLYGIIENPIQVMAVAFTIKMGTMLLLTPFVLGAKKYLFRD